MKECEVPKEMQKRVAYIHFNKPLCDKGFPWTVHFAGACFPCKSVQIKCESETKFRADSKKNPRAFIRAVGRVLIANGNAIIF